MTEWSLWLISIVKNGCELSVHRKNFTLNDGQQCFNPLFCLIFAFISSIYIFVFILRCFSSCAANKLFLWPIVGHTNGKLRGYKAILNWGSPRATRSNNSRGKKKMASLRNNNVTQRFIECNKRNKYAVFCCRNQKFIYDAWAELAWSFVVIGEGVTSLVGWRFRNFQFWIFFLGKSTSLKDK